MTFATPNQALPYPSDSGSTISTTRRCLVLPWAVTLPLVGPNQLPEHIALLVPKPSTLTIVQKTSQLFLAISDILILSMNLELNQKTIAALTHRFIPHRLHLRRYPELFRRESTGDNPTHIHLPRFPGIAPHVVSTTSPRKIYHEFPRSVWAGLKEHECVAGICDLPDHGDLVRKDFRTVKL